MDKGLGWVLGWDNEAYKWGGGTMRGVRRVRGMSWGSTELGVFHCWGSTELRCSIALLHSVAVKHIELGFHYWVGGQTADTHRRRVK